MRASYEDPRGSAGLMSQRSDCESSCSHLHTDTKDRKVGILTIRACFRSCRRAVSSCNIFLLANHAESCWDSLPYSHSAPADHGRQHSDIRRFGVVMFCTSNHRLQIKYQWPLITMIVMRSANAAGLVSAAIAVPADDLCQRVWTERQVLQPADVLRHPAEF